PSGWPWAMLRVGKSPVLALDVELDAALLDQHGVVEVQTFRVEAPEVWLFVYGFVDQASALAATDVLLEWSSDQGRPWYPADVVNGAYLLIAGFPGEKPPSPEMEAARDAYIQSFAGQE